MKNTTGNSPGQKRGPEERFEQEVEETTQEYRVIDCLITQETHRNVVIKVKAHLELNLERNVKSKNKGFYRYISCKEKMRENVGPLLHGVGHLVKKDMGKAEVLHAFFASLMGRLAYENPRALGATGKSGARKVPSVEKH